MTVPSSRWPISGNRPTQESGAVDIGLGREHRDAIGIDGRKISTVLKCVHQRVPEGSWLVAERRGTDTHDNFCRDEGGTARRLALKDFAGTRRDGYPNVLQNVVHRSACEARCDWREPAGVIGSNDQGALPVGRRAVISTLPTTVQPPVTTTKHASEPIVKSRDVLATAVLRGRPGGRPHELARQQ